MKTWDEAMSMATASKTSRERRFWLDYAKEVRHAANDQGATDDAGLDVAGVLAAVRQATHAGGSAVLHASSTEVWVSASMLAMSMGREHELASVARVLAGLSLDGGPVQRRSINRVRVYRLPRAVVTP